MKKRIVLVIALISGIVFSQLSQGQVPSWMWARHFGGSGNEITYGITTDAAGCIYETGFFDSPTLTFGSTTLINSGNFDIYFVKYDPMGNVRWARSVGGPAADRGDCIAADNNGNIYIGGSFESSAINFGGITLTGTGTGNSYIAKYDTAGNAIWARSITGDLNGVSEISVNPYGGIYTAGTFQTTVTAGTLNLSSLGVLDAFLIKYDASGNAIWARTVGGSSPEYSRGLASAADGSVCLTGYAMSSTVIFGTDTTLNGAIANQFTAKYDASGNFMWVRTFTASSSSGINGVTIDPGGSVYITGGFDSQTSFDSISVTPAGNSDIFITKYNSTGHLQWVMTAGGSGNDQGLGITNDGMGNIILSGRFSSPTLTIGPSLLTFSGGSIDAVVAVYNAAGNALGAIKAGGNGLALAFPISAHPCGVAAVGFHSNCSSLTIGSNSFATSGLSDLYVARIGGLVTGVHENERSAGEYTLYPNPATDKLTVTLPQGVMSAEIKIFDLLGALKYSSHVSGRNTALNIAGLAAGLYFVRICSGDTSNEFTFIKQ